jgi:hypothetical protein
MSKWVIQWVQEADEPVKTYRGMVVGWQNIRYSLQSTVFLFNSLYFKANDRIKKSPHHTMRLITRKKLAIAALREIKPQLEKWYRELDKRGVLSKKSIDEKKRVRYVIKRADKFVKIRNLAFHFGDPNEDTNKLLSLYREIDQTDINLLNLILRELVSLGECLKHDAHAKCK